jgi:hypothetical protein
MESVAISTYMSITEIGCERERRNKRERERERAIKKEDEDEDYGRDKLFTLSELFL